MAEVSNHNEPIGRGCVALVRKSIDVGSRGLVANRFWMPFDLRFVCPSLLQIQVSWLSVVVRLKRFVCQAIWDGSWFEIPRIWLSMNLKFKGLGCELIWDSNGWVVFGRLTQLILAVNALRFKWFGNQLIWDSRATGLVFNWFEIQGNWLWNDLRSKWFGCQSIWDSNDLVVDWFEIEVTWWAIDWRFKGFGYVVNWCESQMIWLSTDLKFNHRHHRARNPCACHAKSIISDTLLIPRACQRFCNPHKLLRLPRILKRLEIPVPTTRKALCTSKSGPRPWCFNDFDFQTVVARRRGANFADSNFQKCSDHVSF